MPLDSSDRPSATGAPSVVVQILLSGHVGYKARETSRHLGISFEGLASRSEVLDDAVTG